jgi:hypothetical protein
MAPAAGQRATLRPAAGYWSGRSLPTLSVGGVKGTPRWSSDDRFLAAPVQGDDGAVQLWDLGLGDLASVQTGGPPKLAEKFTAPRIASGGRCRFDFVMAGESTVAKSAIVFADPGLTLCVLDAEGRVVVQRLLMGRIDALFASSTSTTHITPATPTVPARVFGVSCDADSGLFAVTRGVSTEIWQLPADLVAGQPTRLAELPGVAAAVEFLPDRLGVAIAQGAEVGVFSLSGQRLDRLIQHESNISALEYDAKQQLLLSGDSSGKIHEWSLGALVAGVVGPDEPGLARVAWGGPGQKPEQKAGNAVIREDGQLVIRRSVPIEFTLGIPHDCPRTEVGNAKQAAIHHCVERHQLIGAHSADFRTQVAVIDLGTGKERWRPAPFGGDVFSVTMCPRSGRVAVATNTATLVDDTADQVGGAGAGAGAGVGAGVGAGAGAGTGVATGAGEGAVSLTFPRATFDKALVFASPNRLFGLSSTGELALYDLDRNQRTVITTITTGLDGEVRLLALTESDIAVFSEKAQLITVVPLRTPQHQVEFPLPCRAERVTASADGRELYIQRPDESVLTLRMNPAAKGAR